jgi:hypothetical protein
LKSLKASDNEQGRQNINSKAVTSQARIFKRRFDTALRHVKLILMFYRGAIPNDDWTNLLNQTKQSIIQNPRDFFGDNIPPAEITTEAINQVFDGFMHDIRIRRIQAFRNTPVGP